MMVKLVIAVLELLDLLDETALRQVQLRVQILMDIRKGANNGTPL
jgi:hypothetical protein